MLLFETIDTGRDENAKIKVVGVGGGGGNTVDTMIARGLDNVEFIVANTDAQNLRAKRADNRIQLGGDLTRGLGAGADPEIGRQAAEQSLADIRESIGNADMVFVTAGMGGGTGTGAAPIIAAAARELGALTVGIVTKPFRFEGGQRNRNAEGGIEELEQACDTVLVIPNDRIFQLAPKGTPAAQAFQLSDQVLYFAVSGISDLITKPGFINLDFNDIRTVMKDGGKALMGAAVCEGDDRAVRAMEEAVRSPLLEDASIEGAGAILVNISGGPDVSIDEINQAMDVIQGLVDMEGVNLIFGHSEDASMEGKFRVTIVAAGYNRSTRFASTLSASNSFSSSYEQSGLNNATGMDNAMVMGGVNDNLDIPAYLRLSKDNPYRGD